MAKPPPNVVLVIMDDLAYGDLACHGNPYTHTPHLDRMHEKSVRFTQTCSGPVCTPARTMLMTGRYAQRTKAIDTYCGRSTIDPDEITLAQTLKRAGYATCISGKWHLGDNYPSRAMDLGFDEALVHNGGGLRQPANAGHWDGKDSYFDPVLLHNGMPTGSRGYCTDVFTDHTLQFIEKNRDHPFFAYLATNAPHTPLEIGEEWFKPHQEKGLTENLARVYGMVDNIDHNVGRVFAKLDELGITDNTIVIYTSDHGPCKSASDDGKVRFNCGLRDAKGTVYEGGVRVPCFWHWPAAIPQGRTVNTLMSPIDFLPTLAEACGAQLPTDRKIDGISLLPLLEESTAPSEWPDRNVFLQWHRGDVPQLYTNCLARNQRYKLINGTELYDMEHDPGEQKDIAGEQPGLVAELRGAYEEWFHDVANTRPDNYAVQRPIVGTAHECPLVLNLNDRRAHGHDGWGDWPGHWPVTFAKPDSHHYKVEIELSPADVPGTLRLICGATGVSAPVPAGERFFTFENLEIAPGPANVECWLVAGNQRTAARYVSLS